MANSIYTKIKKRIEIAEGNCICNFGFYGYCNYYNSQKLSWETVRRKEYPKDFRWNI